MCFIYIYIEKKHAIRLFCQLVEAQGAPEVPSVRLSAPEGGVTTVLHFVAETPLAAVRNGQVGFRDPFGNFSERV